MRVCLPPWVFCSAVRLEERQRASRTRCATCSTLACTATVCLLPSLLSELMGKPALILLTQNKYFSWVQAKKGGDREHAGIVDPRQGPYKPLIYVRWDGKCCFFFSSTAASCKRVEVHEYDKQAKSCLASMLHWQWAEHAGQCLPSRGV